jgi:pyruvate dehydrogenase E2 component (dihydrolipoyllysine-residue acetyltransferase)
LATEIIMPKLGMSMEEGKIARWMKSEGEDVEMGEPLFEVETDKVNMEVEALLSGVLLKILRDPGDVVPVTEIIGYMGDAGEKWVPGENDLTKKIDPEDNKTTEEDRPAPASPESVTTTDPKDRIQGTRVPATPAARRIAAEKGLDLKTVRATGLHGEIRARDVEKVMAVSATPLARKIANTEGIVLSNVNGTGVGGRITKEDVLKELATAEKGFDPKTVKTAKDHPEPIRKKMAGMRRIIADRMLQSHLQAPPVTQHMRADVTELLALRKQLNEMMEDRISLNDLAMKATAMALYEHPEMNVSVDGEDLVYHPEINLGMAVALEEGLIVPVIRSADRLSLADLSRKAKDLATRAREKRLGPDEITGGTFTVSNMGPFDLFAFTPILNPPEAGILGVCTIEKHIQMEGGKIEERRLMGLSLTFDHRAIDGAQSAVFLGRIRSLLERPLEILMR